MTTGGPFYFLRRLVVFVDGVEERPTHVNRRDTEPKERIFYPDFYHGVCVVSTPTFYESCPGLCTEAFTVDQTKDLLILIETYRPYLSRPSSPSFSPAPTLVVTVPPRN